MSNQAFNQEKGNAGEYAASRYLRQQGFRILTRNFRGRHGEIDIIALRDQVLHFIEVKNRTGNLIPGRCAVNTAKQKHIRDTVQVYLTKNQQWVDYLMSFDVIEITDGNLEFLENCFY